MKDLRRHPYIVSLSDVIRDSESTTLILEYVSSTPYLHGIATWSNFTESDAQASMKQLLKAINYCHKHKIIHRVSSIIVFRGGLRGRVPGFQKPPPCHFNNILYSSLGLKERNCCISCF